MKVGSCPQAQQPRVFRLLSDTQCQGLTQENVHIRENQWQECRQSKAKNWKIAWCTIRVDISSSGRYTLRFLARWDLRQKMEKEGVEQGGRGMVKNQELGKQTADVSPATAGNQKFTEMYYLKTHVREVTFFAALALVFTYLDSGSSSMPSSLRMPRPGFWIPSQTPSVNKRSRRSAWFCPSSSLYSPFVL